MGLDISICVDNNDQVYSADYYGPKLSEYFNNHSLSRAFCNLMCRRDIISEEPELDQIGRITSVDILPVYEMLSEDSGNDEEIEFYLERADNDEERQKILEEAKQKKESFKRNNIDKVLFTINMLIDKLSAIDNLPELLNNHGYDTLGYENYFTDFKIDKGEGYIGNNFGQDLRNFRRFLEFAKTKGTTTVYFSYG